MFTKALMTAVMCALLSFPAFAQTPAAPVQPMGGMGAGGGMGGGMGMMGPGRYMLSPESLQSLKQELSLTPQQEPLWKTYADSMTSMWDMRNAMRQAVQGQPMSRDEHMKMRAEHMKDAQPMREDLKNARTALSAALSSQQRTILDAKSPEMPIDFEAPAPKTSGGK